MSNQNNNLNHPALNVEHACKRETAVYVSRSTHEEVLPRKIIANCDNHPPVIIYMPKRLGKSRLPLIDLQWERGKL